MFGARPPVHNARPRTGVCVDESSVPGSIGITREAGTHGGNVDRWDSAMKACLYRWRTTYALGLTVLCLSLLVSAQTPIDYRRPPAKDWPVVGGDWGNTRYSPLAAINRSNVKTLKGAWR